MERAEITLLLLGAMALLVPVGLMLHASGASRSKNAVAALLRGVVQLALATLAFWAIGAAIIMSRGWGIFGLNRKLLLLAGGDASLFVSAIFFYLVLMLIAVTPIAGAMGERARTLPIWVATVLFAGIIVPLLGYWVWAPAGWLFRIRFLDDAGASVILMSGGIAASMGAFFVGPRANKYNTDGSSNLIPGHSTPLAAAGLLLAVVGWFPYVIGACLIHHHSPTRGAINAALAMAASIVVTYGMSRAKFGKPDVLLTFGGMLAGLVSISAGAGVVNPVAAVAIGAVGGILVMSATVIIDMNWKIDDPSGTIAAHIVGGAWGTLAAGLFAPQESIGARIRQIGVQALGLVVIALLAGAVAWGTFYLLKRAWGLRVSEADEYDGIDLAEHDLNAYPDFQQTMIKSYHLREA